MRQYGAEFIGIPVPPDTTVDTLLTAGTGQAYDWPSSTASSAGSSGQTDIVRLTGVTTAGAGLALGINLYSTAARWSAAVSSFTTGSSGTYIVPPGYSRVFQRPANSTGFSVISGSSGIASIECWRK